MTKLIRYETAVEYLKDNQRWLERREALNSLLLGLTLDSAKRDIDDGFYLTLQSGNEIQFAGMQTKGRNLIVYSDELLPADSLSVLAEHLEKEKPNLPGILGPKEIALQLGAALKDRLGWSNKVVYEQLVYELVEVKYNPPFAGELRRATLEDIDLVSNWMHRFLVEALNEDDETAARANAAKKIKNEEVFFWNNGEDVSMTCLARPTNNGITVNYVFTPPEHRKKGYGTKVVAELSQLALEKGYRFCTLFTDRNNPTSNDIYRRIGYELIGEFRSLEFVRNAG